jgi:hypothetical protein
MKKLLSQLRMIEKLAPYQKYLELPVRIVATVVGTGIYQAVPKFMH